MGKLPEQEQGGKVREKEGIREKQKRDPRVQSVIENVQHGLIRDKRAVKMLGGEGIVVQARVRVRGRVRVYARGRMAREKGREGSMRVNIKGRGVTEVTRMTLHAVW